ncbi:hypothetical protein SPFM15_00053 [Salmonella phage SPFM15]|nr:hypothetical protein SPFM5_00048 [Salmonella phage SPFM5]VFR13677.1 hypothetical protein SPFM15_00053 [Salmonella phage SPFM15]
MLELYQRDRKGESSEPRWLDHYFGASDNRVSSSNIPNQRWLELPEAILRIRDFDTLVERLEFFISEYEPLEYNGKEYLPFSLRGQLEFHKNTHNTLHRVMVGLELITLSTLLRRKAVEARRRSLEAERYYLSETTSHNRITPMLFKWNAWYFTSSLMG